MPSMTHNIARRTLMLAVVAAAFALLVVPAVASAVTVSGTVSLSSGSFSAGHPVTVELWVKDPAQPGAFYPSEHFAEATTGGAYSILNVTPGTYYVVAYDFPYHWYEMTVYNSLSADKGEPVVGTWDPSAGTTVVVGAANVPIPNMTLAVLPVSFTGKAKDSKTGAAIADVMVSTYYLDAGEWLQDFYQTDTAADGTYRLSGLPAGTYRLGFTDLAGKYTDTYYSGKATLATANNVVAGASPVALLDTSMTHVVSVQRIAPTSSNYWSQAVNVTKRQYTWDPAPVSASNQPDYVDVAHIVIASGDSRAAADPLAAAGLAWAYQVNDDSSDNAMMNAPLLLVSATRTTDATVRALIAYIATHNGRTGMPNKRLTIHVVGGTGSVPDARFNEISKAITDKGGQAPIKKRVSPNNDRFALAQAIALEMKAQAAKSTVDSLMLPGFALVANGADSAKFFDPLALSPIAAANGAPILLVAYNSVPAATTAAIKSLGYPKVYVGGGAGTVSATVNTKLKATRIWGADRYRNAIAIADKAITMGWLYDDQGLAIASTIADAQLGGTLAGNEASPLLITPSTSLNPYVKTWLTKKKANLGHIYVVGSTTSLNAATNTAIVNAVK